MPQLNSVQGLRALAAAQVVIAHGGLWAGGFGPIGLPHGGYEMLGSLGVLMFFTISGFLMLHISRDQFGVPNAASRFMRRRIIRIIPLYWLATSLALFLTWRKSGLPRVGDVIQSYAFIPYQGDSNEMRPILGVGWTLNYEMFFYLIFALALTIKRGRTFIFVIMFALIFIGQHINPIESYRTPSSAIEAWTSPSLIPFLIGMAIALLRSAKPALRVSHPLLLVVAMILAVLLIQNFAMEGSVYTWKWRLTVIFLGAFTAGLAIMAHGEARVPAWLVFLGDASYSMYLIHPFMFGVLKRMHGDAIAAEMPFIALILFVAISIVAGIALHVFVEKPLVTLLRNATVWPPFQKTYDV